MADSKKFYLPTEVRFGRGSVECLGDLVDRNQKVFLVTDPGVEKAGLAGKAQAILEGAGASITVFDQVEPNPSAELVEKALKALKETGATMVVAVGGGSALDLSKVVAALATNPGTLEEYQWNGRQFEQESLPFVAVPTTSGTGSEVTRVAVIVDRNTKKGVGHDRLFPRVAVVDPGMTVGLPRGLTAATGMDALSHAVEAYVSLGASPFTDGWALTAAELIGRSLLRACVAGDDLDAREQMALASTLAGVAMDQGGLGVVHSMAGPLCSYYHLPHGLACAILLPYGMSFNLAAKPERMARLASALGCETNGLSALEAGREAVAAVYRLVRETGLALDLAKFGIKESDADLVAEETTKMFLIKNNPRRPSVAECRALFLAVLNGEEPLSCTF